MTSSLSERLDVSRRIEKAKGSPIFRVEGRVEKAMGQLLEIAGVDAPVGAELVLEGNGGEVRVEVLGFRNGVLLAAPLGGTGGIAPGARVRVSMQAASIAVGDAMLGRIVDAFGRPLDGKPAPVCSELAPIHASPPPAFGRRPIQEVFDSGVRAIDGLLPLGRGQRLGLFAGAGVGKSTLLGMMCRSAAVDVVVVGLIGERGRELGDFVRVALGPEGLAKSVVVAATSDQPPLVRARGALTATAIAEHYRRQGREVLLVMDSVTRFAMALREATLAAGEPPLTKGYTPTVFAALPALLERAGCGAEGEGTITAIYTVLAEGDDLADPVADAVKGILDGHIVLARSLADRGIFPAIDVLRSISRVAPDVAPRIQLDAVARIRDLLAAEEESRDLVRIGAYVAGSDPRIDAARVAVPMIEAMLKQRHDELVTREEAFGALASIVGAV
ncbi:MAG: FliI/YscN family ATPase [Deltaproteobacteria bacterium]|nr:FliI/YscN family ATPase [Deltaproteobacteria bacterium]